MLLTTNVLTTLTKICLTLNYKKITMFLEFHTSKMCLHFYAF